MLAVAFAVAMLSLCLANFGRTARYITSMMNAASDDKEYTRWRRELSCHYLRLIPFITKKNVSWFYDRFVYKPKYAKKEERYDGIYHLLAPSLAGVVLCVTCLFGVSWAWFTSSQSATAGEVRSAAFTAAIEVVDADTEVAVTPTLSDDGWDFEYVLSAGAEYGVSITAGGTATTGYCSVYFKDNTLREYTVQLAPGDSVAFTAYATSEGGTLVIAPRWGVGPAASSKLGQTDSDTIGEPSTPPSGTTGLQMPSSVTSSAVRVPEATTADQTTSTDTATNETSSDPATTETTGAETTADSTASTDTATSPVTSGAVSAPAGEHGGNASDTPNEEGREPVAPSDTTPEASPKG